MDLHLRDKTGLASDRSSYSNMENIPIEQHNEDNKEGWKTGVSVARDRNTIEHTREQNVEYGDDWADVILCGSLGEEVDLSD